MKIILIALVVLVVAVIGAFVVMGAQSRGGEAPGTSDTRLTPCGTSPNCVSSTAPPDSAQYVAAFALRAGAEDAAWTDLIEVIATAGGKVNENAPPYLGTTFTSSMFGFVDDFECLIDQDAGVIHVRAGARVGYSDMDVNRTRVERIREMLAERAGG